MAPCQGNRRGKTKLKLARENVTQADLQFSQNRFQAVERQMMLSPFDAVQGRMREPGFSGERCVGKLAPGPPEKASELAIQFSAHGRTVAKHLSRMCDEMREGK